MALRIKLKTLLLLALLLLIPLFSAEGCEDGMNPKRSLHKDVTRKLLKMMDAVLDYDDAGANPKHDPKRKPGSSKNP